MPSFDVAHIREQGQNMLLFPLDGSFEHKPSSEQQVTLAELQSRAHAAGLAGKAVAVWARGDRTHFLGPRAWHNFLSSISMSFVLANVNKKVWW